MIKLTRVFVLAISLTAQVTSDECTLPDVARTPGHCTGIRNCKYQIARLRFGSTVTRCSENGSACCPITNSTSEKKCLEWREMLHAPPSFTLPRLDKPACAIGQKVQLIVGGRDADLFEYPHAVSLGYGNNPDQLKFLCGATLISESFLITAAHCIANQRAGRPSYAVIGDIILDPSREHVTPSPYRKIVKISNHIVHPGYKSPLIYNDIALLKLSSPVELSKFVLPACLGGPWTTPNFNSKKPHLVEACGWGITDVASQRTSNILQAINITTVDSNSCNAIYEQEPDKGFRYPDGIIKSQMCATGEDKDTCRGDSGGGLFIRESTCVFHLVGITSIGSKLCGLGSPSVYTTVASYQDWIESTVWG